MSYPSVELFGIPFSRISSEGMIDEVNSSVSEHHGLPGTRHALTPNVDFIRRAQGSSSAKQLIRGADYVLCDSRPVFWLSRIFRRNLPEQVAGSDLVPRLLEDANEKARSLFLFGSDEATLEKVRSRLATDYPKVRVAGSISPPFGEIEDWDNEAYLAEINNSKPDLLLVGLGFPKQDQWIARYKRRLAVPISFGVGASLDFIAGKQTRAPRWVKLVGFEWLWRFGTDPLRLGPRYVAGFSALGKAVLTQLGWIGLRRLRFNRRRRRSQRKLFNGAILPGTVVARFEEGHEPLVSKTVAQEGDWNGVACDLAGLDNLDSKSEEVLSRLLRDAARSGKQAAVLSPSAQVRAYLRLSGWSELVKQFDDPVAFRVWATPEKHPVQMPPSGSRALTRAVVCSVREAAANRPPVGVIPICFQGRNRLRRSEAVFIDSLQQSLPGGRIRLVNVSHALKDLLRINGASAFLSISFFLATLFLR
ncbi:MAG: WecB/TagA/CpsF family glycosyltransferase [Verrucomicrobiota bacterium]